MIVFKSHITYMKKHVYPIFYHAMSMA